MIETKITAGFSYAFCYLVLLEYFFSAFQPENTTVI